MSKQTELFDVMKEGAKEFNRRVDELVRSNPLVSFITAVGVGVLGSLLLAQDFAKAPRKGGG